LAPLATATTTPGCSRTRRRCLRRRVACTSGSRYELVIEFSLIELDTKLLGSPARAIPLFFQKRKFKLIYFQMKQFTSAVKGVRWRNGSVNQPLRHFLSAERNKAIQFELIELSRMVVRVFGFSLSEVFLLGEKSRKRGKLFLKSNSTPGN
jgi:hypothetical protein